jgi:hypothetical protein
LKSDPYNYPGFAALRKSLVELGRTIIAVIWVRVIGRRVDHAKKTVCPRNAEFLFYLFLDPKTCDGLVGDLEERYKFIFDKFGKAKADFWYWSQAIGSTGPIVWAWFKTPVLRLFGWLLTKKIR